jgi:hypothetical protein
MTPSASTDVFLWIVAKYTSARDSLNFLTWPNQNSHNIFLDFVPSGNSTVEL